MNWATLRPELTAVWSAAVAVHKDDVNILLEHAGGITSSTSSPHSPNSPSSSSGANTISNSKASGLLEVWPWGVEGRVWVMINLGLVLTDPEFELLGKYRQLQQRVALLAPKHQGLVQCMLQLPLELQFPRLQAFLAWQKQCSEEGEGRSRWFSERSQIASFGVQRPLVYFMEQLGVDTLPLLARGRELTQTVYCIAPHMVRWNEAFCRPSEVKCPLQVLLDTVLVPFSLLAAAADALLRTVSALLQRNTGSGTTFSSSIATSPRLIAISNLAATPSLMLAANSSSGSSNGSGGGGGGDGGGSSSLLAAGSSPVSDLPAVYQPLRTLLLLGHCSMLDVRWVDATGDHFATVTAADFKLDNGRGVHEVDGARIVRVHAVPGLWLNMPLAKAAAVAATALSLLQLARNSARPACSPFMKALQMFEQQMSAVATITPALLTLAANADQVTGERCAVNEGVFQRGDVAAAEAAGVPGSASENTGAAAGGEGAAGAEGDAGSSPARKVHVLSSAATCAMAPTAGQRLVKITTPPVANSDEQAAARGFFDKQSQQMQQRGIGGELFGREEPEDTTMEDATEAEMHRQQAIQHQLVEQHFQSWQRQQQQQASTQVAASAPRRSTRPRQGSSRAMAAFEKLGEQEPAVKQGKGRSR